MSSPTSHVSQTSEETPASPRGQRRMTSPRPRRTAMPGSATRAVAAGIAITLLLTVVPLLLVRLSAALPLDLSALSPEGLISPDDGALLLLLLVSIAWLSWTVLAASVVVELGAALRGVPTPRIPGLAVPQRCAGVLVTALLVGTIPVGAAASEPALGTMDLASAVRTAAADIDDLVLLLDGRAAASPTSPDRPAQSDDPQTAELPTIVTQRHDTLWLLAEQHLGSGERFEEIVELNRGVRQPDGRALADEGRLYPGWVLRMPADADLQAPRTDRVVVKPGDTLWAIADEQLQDPTRFRELADDNRGDLQPDGKRLRDADLILPGWVIAVPTSAQTPQRGGEAAASPAGNGAPASPASDGAAAAEALDGRVPPGPTHASGPEAASDAGSAPRSAPGADEAGSELPAAGGSASGRGADAQSRPGSTAAPTAVESAPGETGFGGSRSLQPDESAAGETAAGGSARGLEVPGSAGSTPSASASVSSTGDPARPDEQPGAAATAPPASAEGTPGTARTPSEGVIETAPGTAPGAAAPASPAAVPPVPLRPAAEPTTAPEQPDRGARAGESGAPGADSDDGVGLREPGAESVTDWDGARAGEPGADPEMDTDGAREPQADPVTDPDEGSSVGEARGDLGATSGDQAGFVLPAGGVAAGLLLAALGMELARRRVQFQRWRRPGEQLPVPSARARRLETSLLKGQNARDDELLSAALGALGRSSTPASVRVVEVGADCVIVHLGEDWGVADAPAPFRIVAPGVVQATRDDLRACAVDAPARIDGPALVTVGTRDEWTVLVDLQTVGTLRVAGDDVIVGEVLRAIGAEVALDARHRGSTRTLCLLDPMVAEAAETGEVIVDADPDRVGRAVTTALRRARGMCGSGVTPVGLSVSTRSGDVSTRPGDGLPGEDLAAAELGPAGVAVLETSTVIDLRTAEGTGPRDGLGVSCDGAGPHSTGSRSFPDLRHDGGAGGGIGDLWGADRRSGTWDDWSDPFEIVVVDRPIGVEVSPRSGVGLVTSAAATGQPGITLSVLDVGRAVLVEDGIELVPVGLSSATVDDLVELFAATEVPGKPAEDLGIALGGETPDASERGEVASTGGEVASAHDEVASAHEDIDGAAQVTGAVGSDSATEPNTPAELSMVAEQTSVLEPTAVVQPARVTESRVVALPTSATWPTQEIRPTLATGPTLSPGPSTPGPAEPSGAPDPDVHAGAARQEGAADGMHRGARDVGDRAASHPSDATGRTEHAPEQPTAGRSSDQAEPQVPRLLLLGDVEVEHAQGRAESTRLGRLAETAAFVLLHPDARPSELLAALWPGRNANPQSCRQMISRTRSWLGRTDDGEPYLEPFAQTNGRLRLRPEVRSDWDDFQDLADRGMADPQDVDNLTAALELVRGRPFGSLWRRELAWADLDSHRMISRIVDVGYELARRHEAAGRTREARAAVHRALRTQVESELLDELLERLGSG